MDAKEHKMVLFSISSACFVMVDLRQFLESNEMNVYLFLSPSGLSLSRFPLPQWKMNQIAVSLSWYNYLP